MTDVPSPTRVEGYILLQDPPQRRDPLHFLSHFHCTRTNVIRMAIGISTFVATSVVGALLMDNRPTYYRPLGGAIFFSGTFGGIGTTILPWDQIPRVAIISGGLALTTSINFAVAHQSPELKIYCAAFQVISIVAAIFGVAFCPRNCTQRTVQATVVNV